MKIRIYLKTFLLSVLFLPGCIREDLSGCETDEDDGLVIHFTYTTDKKNDEFSSRIEQVDLFVFDEGGYYLSHHTYNAHKLAQFQGAPDLALEAGTYHIICWGNIYGNDDISTLTEEMMIHSARIIYGGNASGGDSLYYAPRKTSASINDLPLYQVTVAEKGKTEATFDFMTAYYTLNVFVNGFEDYIGNHNQNPSIEVTNLPEYYDFNLTLGEYGQRFSKVSRQVQHEGETYAHSSFHIRYIEEENPVGIHVVRSTTGERAYTVDLQDILVANRVFLKLGEHTNINIYIEFHPDGSVEVSLQITGWDNTGVTPGLR